MLSPIDSFGVGVLRVVVNFGQFPRPRIVGKYPVIERVSHFLDVVCQDFCLFSVLNAVVALSVISDQDLVVGNGVKHLVKRKILILPLNIDVVLLYSACRHIKVPGVSV